MSTREWNREVTTGDMPVELASHAALLVGNRLLVYGGTGTPFGYASSNRLHVCNLSTLEWRQVACCGDVPDELYGHSLSLAGDVIFMFGGTTGYEYSNDLHCLSLDTFTWQKFDVKEQKVPEGRYRHEAIHDKLTDRLYVMGGGRANISYGFEELDAFDINSQKWLKIQSQSAGRQGYPEARRCHSCVKFKGNAYICGGYNGEKIFSDLWALDLETLYWCKITDMPKPVYFHAADVSPSGCLYIFGGVNQIDLVRNANVYKIWLQPPSLQEACWINLCNLIKDIERLPRPMLIQMGVPLALLDRLT
ncbi:kelch domain-containing protein 10-like isoform X2 [Lineus longissimus]